MSQQKIVGGKKCWLNVLVSGFLVEFSLSIVCESLISIFFVCEFRTRFISVSHKFRLQRLLLASSLATFRNSLANV